MSCVVCDDRDAMGRYSIEVARRLDRAMGLNCADGRTMLLSLSLSRQPCTHGRFASRFPARSCCCFSFVLLHGGLPNCAINVWQARVYDWFCVGVFLDLTSPSLPSSFLRCNCGGQQEGTDDVF